MADGWVPGLTAEELVGLFPLPVDDGHPDPQTDGLTDAELRASPVPVIDAAAIAELQALVAELADHATTAGQASQLAELQALVAELVDHATAAGQSAQLVELQLLVAELADHATATGQASQLVELQLLVAELADHATETTLAAVLAAIQALPTSFAGLATEAKQDEQLTEARIVRRASQGTGRDHQQGVFVVGAPTVIPAGKYLWVTALTFNWNATSATGSTNAAITDSTGFFYGATAPSDSVQLTVAGNVIGNTQEWSHTSHHSFPDEPLRLEGTVTTTATRANGVGVYYVGYLEDQ